MFSLEGRTAVITGAGSGIGAAVAESLFKMKANVCLIAKSSDKVSKVTENIDPTFKKAKQYVCDVTNEESLIKVKEEILKDFKKIDILVTCAAAPGTAAKSEELSFKEWRKVLETDLDGVFLCCKTFGACMLENKYGRIVNLTSFHNVCTYPQRVAYNAAKSGVEGISRALAVEWGRYSITVNSVAPGPIRTPRTSYFLSQSPDIEQSMIDRTPNARLGETEEVASLISFLVSDEARHINGQQIVIDGGWSKSAWWGKYSNE